MPAKANRCPHCWSALADYVNDFCPHCRGSVAPKQKRRRGGETPQAKTVSPPPAAAPSQPYEPYLPYEPPTPAQPTQPAQPAQPYEPYQPYEYSSPPPAQPAPAPVATAAQVVPAGGGVAVAERDPVEFPGTPLPQGFFGTLPEKKREPKTRRVSLKTFCVGGAIALASMGGIAGIRNAAERDDAMSSLARPLIKDACAEYRDFTTRLRKNPDDIDAWRQAVIWFQSNVETFSGAVQLDPQLNGASEVVAWFNGAIDADLTPIEAMTEDDLEALERPLVKACYLGPGRA